MFVYFSLYLLTLIVILTLCLPHFGNNEAWRYTQMNICAAIYLHTPITKRLIKRKIFYLQLDKKWYIRKSHIQYELHQSWVYIFTPDSGRGRQKESIINIHASRIPLLVHQLSLHFSQIHIRQFWRIFGQDTATLVTECQRRSSSSPSFSNYEFDMKKTSTAYHISYVSI